MCLSHGPGAERPLPRAGLARNIPVVFSPGNLLALQGLLCSVILALHPWFGMTSGVSSHGPGGRPPVGSGCFGDCGGCCSCGVIAGSSVRLLQKVPCLAPLGFLQGIAGAKAAIIPKASEIIVLDLVGSPAAD